jgi:putative restriction endonuclease
LESIVDDVESALRATAITHVVALAQRKGVLAWDDIAAGFEFRGEIVRLATRARGIFKPKQLRSGALSIKTTLPRKGRIARYDDQIGSNQPWFEYRYQGDDALARDNRDLRDCLRRQMPIIYFYGTKDEGHYDALISLVVGEDTATKTFHVSPIGEVQRAVSPILRTAAISFERQYSITTVRRRLHQERFRSAVLEAYEKRCAICRLRHEELLDAAHIVADGERLGEAKVPNGLALCKLHHAAFDNLFIGIDPDCKIHVRDDLLTERDGPMLEHGLRAFDGSRLEPPAEPADQPDRDLLDLRWQRFCA